MIQKEIIECNKLIKEFYGDISGITSYPDEPLEFHSSWDWLMPVIEKIESLHHTVGIHDTMCEILTERNLCEVLIKVNEDWTKIKVVYTAAVEFIKWYNKNK